MTEMETTFDLEISLDLEDREIVLSSPPRDDGLMMHEEKKEVPLFKKQREKKMTPGSDLEKLEPALNLRHRLLLSVKKKKESGMRNWRELQIVL